MPSVSLPRPHALRAAFGWVRTASFRSGSGGTPRAKQAVCALTATLALTGTALAASPDMAGVKVENLSKPVLCAEEDNVTLTFAHSDVTSFKIEAAHPAYIGKIRDDAFAADWTACAFAGEALAQKPPQRITLYEDIEMWLVAHRNEKFWRDAKTKVRIGDKVYDGLHLLQLWTIKPMGGEEVLVIYPQDGYWRLRPKAPAGRAPTAFGSSVLIGPVTEAGGRPVVEISEIAFDPKARSFRLTYADGNAATVTVADLTEKRNQIAITFDRPVTDAPFAAMRSMYVTKFNADAADIAVLDKGAKAWREEPVMSFSGAQAATDVWAGRHVTSRHNTSAPDHVFSSFDTGATSPGR